MKLGDYLVAHLKKIGVSHLFGIPGNLLLSLPSWHYADLARLWGGRGFRVETVAQLRRALDEAAKSASFAIIKVMTGSGDLSPITLKYIRASAKKAQIKMQA